MTNIVIFHSVLGLRPSTSTLAEELRSAGHDVWTPDLWDGESFATIEQGLVKRDDLGIPTIAERAASAAADLPPDSVYIGFSLGAVFAQMLSQTRPGSRGAVLVSGALPLGAFEGSWPKGAALEVHAMEGDDWVDLDVARGLVEAVEAQGDPAELRLHTGGGHLFNEPGLDGYEPTAARALHESVLAFADRLARTRS
jgi:dienelactone hydrolase